jgi:hypothetical protein
MYPFEWLAELLEVLLTLLPSFAFPNLVFQLYMPPSLEYRGLIIGVALINFLLCYLLEVRESNKNLTLRVYTRSLQTLVIDTNWLSSLCKSIARRKTQAKYLHIEEEYKSKPNWPPAVASTATLAELMGQEGLPVAHRRNTSSSADLDFTYDGDLGVHSEGDHPPDSPKSTTMPLLGKDFNAKPRSASTTTATVESTAL